MLAQLERRPDVKRAEVDRHGELLRVVFGGAETALAIRDAVAGMGFAAEESASSDVTLRWYGASSVDELSREESAVIASRVVLQFGAANGLEQTDIDPLSTRVAAALYACLVGNREAGLAPGGLAAPCRRAVEAATRAQLGPDRAALLGRAIEADLAGAARP